jgi:hypothetical protein
MVRALSFLIIFSFYSINYYLMYFHISDLTTEEEATLKYINSTSRKHKVAKIKGILLKRHNLDCVFNPKGWLVDDVSQ